jgi:hypothetical protein
LSNSISTSQMNDNMRSRLEWVLSDFKRDEHIVVSKITQKIESGDKRIHMKPQRLASLLREYKGDLVDYINGKWYKR